MFRHLPFFLPFLRKTFKKICFGLKKESVFIYYFKNRWMPTSAWHTHTHTQTPTRTSKHIVDKTTKTNFQLKKFNFKESRKRTPARSLLFSLSLFLFVSLFLLSFFFFFFYNSLKNEKIAIKIIGRQFQRKT